jgi:hypothetical protein
VIDSDEDTTVSSYELYELSNCSLLKNHVALVVVGKLVGEIFDVALTSLLPAVVPEWFVNPTHQSLAEGPERSAKAPPMSSLSGIGDVCISFDENTEQVLEYLIRDYATLNKRRVIFSVAY